MSRKTRWIILLALTLCAATAYGFPGLMGLLFNKPDIYVVVLEHNWEETLADRQYSEGEMLKSFLAGMKHVEVRHRFFTDAKSLRKWCGEVHLIPGPVVLVFADHGSPAGLHSDENEIGPRAIAEGLAKAKNLKMIHFSACSVFKGDFPLRLIREMGEEHAVPITGYTTDVDWSLSSLVDFMLIHLAAGERRPPFQAYYQTKQMMPIADTKYIPGMGHPPLGLFIVMPEWVFAPSHVSTPEPDALIPVTILPFPFNTTTSSIPDFDEDPELEELFQ